MDRIAEEARRDDMDYQADLVDLRMSELRAEFDKMKNSLLDWEDWLEINS